MKLRNSSEPEASESFMKLIGKLVPRVRGIVKIKKPTIEMMTTKTSQTSDLKMGQCCNVIKSYLELNKDSLEEFELPCVFPRGRY